MKSEEGNFDETLEKGKKSDNGGRPIGTAATMTSIFRREASGSETLFLLLTFCNKRKKYCSFYSRYFGCCTLDKNWVNKVSSSSCRVDNNGPLLKELEMGKVHGAGEDYIQCKFSLCSSMTLRRAAATTSSDE